MDGGQNDWEWWGEILPALDRSSDKLNKITLRSTLVQYEDNNKQTSLFGFAYISAFLIGLQDKINV